MHKNLSGVTFPLLGSLTVSGILIFSHNQVLAQVTPDDTLGDESSVVNTRDDTSDSIDGGAIRGQNLFHSFQEFNVDADRGVYFANPDAVTNIFSRVTGNDVSNILGTLGVDGAANLFLINPNGIIFGEGASLDVQGSFAATTADGIEFGEQGFFSASDPEAPKLLTINPSAYLFNQVAPGAIANLSTANNNGLQVQPGKNISLIGGDITLDGGIIFAPGGGVELGGLNIVGTIGINADSSLSFPENVEKGNVFLSKGSIVSILSSGGGSIAINSKNLELTEGSSLYGGIAAGLGSPEAQAGDIVINATDKVTFDGVGANGLSSGSGIINAVLNQGIGNAGKVEINTNELSLTNGGRIFSGVYGQGNTGEIVINANNVSLDSLGNINRSIWQNGVGNTGKIRITTENLSLTNGGTILSAVFGQGNTGNVTIKASENVSFDGRNISANTPSAVTNSIFATGTGSTGNVNISAKNFSLTNGATVSNSNIGKGTSGKISINTSDTLSINGGSSDDALQNFSRVATNVGSGSSEDKTGSGEGDSGAIEINTKNLAISNGGGISSQVNAKGNSGDITVNASDTTSIDGESPLLTSTIESSITDIGKGNAGKVNLNTKNLIITNGAGISSLVVGRGNAGDVSINASDSIFIDGESKVKIQSSRIFSSVISPGVGNSGNIKIATKDLFVSNGGSILASTAGTGNSGSVKIEAKDEISIDSSSIENRVLAGARGNAQDIVINAKNVSLNRSDISSDSQSKGKAGNIFLEAKDTFSTANGSTITSNIGQQNGEPAEGKVGNITITAKDISFSSGSQLQAGFYSNSQGESGSVSIIATDSLSFDGRNSLTGGNSGIFTNVESKAIANGSDIRLEANSISFSNNAGLTASNSGTGNSGNIWIKASTFSTANDILILSNIGLEDGTPAKGKVGSIAIEADKVALSDRSQIQAGFYSNSQGKSGSVSIKANESIDFNDRSGISTGVDPGAIANGGDIQLEAQSISFSKNSGLSTSNLGQGNGGDITVNVDFISLNNSSIFASNTPSADISTTLSGGNINLEIADQLTLRNNSNISTQASINANGGNIDITADSIIAFDDSDIFAFAADGQGGNITLNTPAYFAENFTLNSLTSNPDSLDNNSRADLNATGAVSSGAVLIPDVSFIQNSLTELENNSINTDELVANSCVSPVGDRQQGKFIITGGQSLPVRPGDGIPSKYPTGEVRNVPESNHSSWRSGDPIVEPQGAYRLANGKLVLSRECSN